MRKKYFFAVLFATLGIAHPPAFGHGQYCGDSYEITYQGFQNATDDEFIYTSAKAFNSAESLESKRGGRLADGKVYECDKEQGCEHNSYFLTTSTSIFKSKPTGDLQLYQCVSGDDRWQKTRVSVCNGLPQKYKDYTNDIVNLNGRNYVLLYDQTEFKHCYLTDQALACFNYNKKNPNRVYWQDNACKCKEYNGKEYVWKNNQCEPVGNTSTTCPNGKKTGDIWSLDCKDARISNGKTCGCRCNSNGTTTCYVTECNGNNYRLSNPITGDVYKKLGAYQYCEQVETIGKCHPSVCTSEICQACCKKPASETIWMPSSKICQCQNGGTFTKESGTWICKVQADQSNNSQAYQCDRTKMLALDGWRTQCANHSEILNLIAELEIYCNGTPTQVGFLELYIALQSAVTTTCTDTQNTTIEIDINTAYNQLKSIHDKFRGNVSVWKDAEGNFNTARLASDSIAGVVLGTAGGLITSNVVKKNQVENGFEDIKCTIGGQNVAAWGDQFRVGIQ